MSSLPSQNSFRINFNQLANTTNTLIDSYQGLPEASFQSFNKFPSSFSKSQSAIHTGFELQQLAEEVYFSRRKQQYNRSHPSESFAQRHYYANDKYDDHCYDEQGRVCRDMEIEYRLYTSNIHQSQRHSLTLALDRMKYVNNWNNIHCYNDLKRLSVAYDRMIPTPFHEITRSSARPVLDGHHSSNRSQMTSSRYIHNDTTTATCDPVTDNNSKRDLVSFDQISKKVTTTETITSNYHERRFEQVENKKEKINTANTNKYEKSRISFSETSKSSPPTLCIQNRPTFRELRRISLMETQAQIKKARKKLSDIQLVKLDKLVLLNTTQVQEATKFICIPPFPKSWPLQKSDAPGLSDYISRESFEFEETNCDSTKGKKNIIGTDEILNENHRLSKRQKIELKDSDTHHDNDVLPCISPSSFSLSSAMCKTVRSSGLELETHYQSVSAGLRPIESSQKMRKKTSTSDKQKMTTEKVIPMTEPLQSSRSQVVSPDPIIKASKDNLLEGHVRNDRVNNPSLHVSSFKNKKSAVAIKLPLNEDSFLDSSIVLEHVEV